MSKETDGQVFCCLADGAAVPATASRCRPETSPGNLGGQGGGHAWREFSSISDPLGLGRERESSPWDCSVGKSASGLAPSRVKTWGCAAFKARTHDAHRETGEEMGLRETRNALKVAPRDTPSRLPLPRPGALLRQARRPGLYEEPGLRSLPLRKTVKSTGAPRALARDRLSSERVALG